MRNFPHTNNIPSVHLLGLILAFSPLSADHAHATPSPQPANGDMVAPSGEGVKRRGPTAQYGGNDYPVWQQQAAQYGGDSDPSSGAAHAYETTTLYTPPTQIGKNLFLFTLVTISVLGETFPSVNGCSCLSSGGWLYLVPLLLITT